MLIVAGTLTFDAANHDAAAAAMQTLRAATLEEDGCEQYVFTASLDTPGLFHVFEEWRDADAMTAHMGAPHMAVFMGACGELGIQGMDISKYEASDKGPLM